MFERGPDIGAVVHVAMRLLQNRHVSGVSCEYREGTLCLRGRSRSFYQKQLAQELVRRVAGVETVVNEIEVDSVAK
jgi:osmotically-inducible protein OsmY